MVKCSDRVISALVTSESNSNLTPRRQSLGDFGKYFKDFNPSMSLDCGKKPSKLPEATGGTRQDSGGTTCFTIMKPSSDLFFTLLSFLQVLGNSEEIV